MQCDNFLLSKKTQTIFKDLANLADLFDFNSLEKNLELFSNKNEKTFDKFKIESSKKIWIDEFFFKK